MQKTEIDTIENSKPEHSEQFLKIEDKNLGKTLMDFSLPLHFRIQCINRYEQLEGRDNTIETVNKLVTLYDITGTKILKDYLFAICEQSLIDPFLKSIIAEGLCYHNDQDEIGYKAIDIVYPLLKKESVAYKLNFVKLLMKNIKFQSQAKQHFFSFINDTNINCDYRYKAILSLESNSENNFFLKESCKEFLLNPNNSINLKILAGQFLLLKFKDYSIQEQLLNFSRDTTIEYNTRADATDVILQLGDDEHKQIARKIIMQLGGMDRSKVSIYGNSQNVHVEELEESVKEILEFLQNYEIQKINGEQITFEYVETKVKELLDEKEVEKNEKVYVALNRIAIDRAIYSKFSCTLVHVLLRVWSYICGHKHEEDMKKRLLEELIEMSGTCSSGYVSRLVNSISGFGDFSIRISWKDQIIANFTGRMNARIRDMDNLTLKDKIMNEMISENCDYQDRKNFLKFLRNNILFIRQELYEEFKSYLDDTDFDLYFRGAVSMYETGQFK